jgi:hypothetical protein
MMATQADVRRIALALPGAEELPDRFAFGVSNKGKAKPLDQKKFFTEPHYNGYPAVLIRLEAVTVSELRPLMTEAWRCQAPKELTDVDPPRRAPRRAARRTTPSRPTRKRS